MVNVSNEWLVAREETLLPETFVEITFVATEPGLQKEAKVSVSEQESFSDISILTDSGEKVGEMYTTLEYGMWGLNGGFNYFDGTPVKPGYVSSSYSKADCTFAKAPKITIDFSRIHEGLIPGMTIVWDKTFHSWATDFIVTSYDSDGMVAQTTVTDNEYATSDVWFDLKGYTKITIEIQKWSHPYHRLRCTDLVMGIKTIYTKSDLISYEHSQSVDLLSAALPNNSVTFSLRNDDNRWNPDNPTGSEKYLLEQQEVTVRYGMDINGNTEWIDGGVFWLTEWSTPANGLEANFTARDAISFMEKTYEGIRVGTLYDIAIAAFTEAELPLHEDDSVRYIVHDSLKDITTDFSEDTNHYTIAEVLQMVANAGCCVFYQDRKGNVYVKPWDMAYSGTIIEPKISYSHPEYNISKPLKAVSVSYGEDLSVEIPALAKGEVQTIDNPLIVTEADATRLGEHVKELLLYRKTIEGDYRADLTLDVLDGIIVMSKYASNIIGISEMKYTNNGGAFKGTYKGRVISLELTPVIYHSGEIHVGEV